MKKCIYLLKSKSNCINCACIPGFVLELHNGKERVTYMQRYCKGNGKCPYKG